MLLGNCKFYFQETVFVLNTPLIFFGFSFPQPLFSTSDPFTFQLFQG